MYQKVGPLGEHLKFGIANNPATRYTDEQLAGGRLRILARGLRADMLALETKASRDASNRSRRGPEFLHSAAGGEGTTSTVALSIPLMKYQIVIQWPASSIADYDSVIEVDSALIDSLSEGNEVDGHDAGSGEMNIFVRTDNVQDAFVEIKGLLAARAALSSARVAYREVGRNEYTILWPEHLKRLSVA